MSARQGRRLELIDAALADVEDGLSPAVMRRLRNAVALAIGLESVVTLRDVCGLSRTEARRTAQWAVRAMVAQAQAEQG